MAHNQALSPVQSLKGKIRLTSIALGAFVCVLGLIACFVQSYLDINVFYIVFVPFLLLSILVTVFGSRLAVQVTEPVERVSLLAKSFERGLTTTLPKTTGAAETDELLHTVYRLSRQTKQIVDAMDAAADGDTRAALAVEIGSDKTSQTFQKLLARVSESIRAKQDLDKLTLAINKITADVSKAREADLTVEARGGDTATEDLSRTLNFLIARLGEMTGQIRASGARAQDYNAAAGSTLADAAREGENQVRELNRVAVALKQVPQAAQKISEDLADSAARAEQAAGKARRGTEKARENLESVATLRRRIQETVRLTRRLRERSRDIAIVAKTIEDLARRATLVSLNASIQSSELGTAGRGFTIVSGEIERLAARAEETGKQVASLNKSVESEIGEIELSLEAAFGEAANLSRFGIETEDALGELEKHVAQFLNLQNDLANYASRQSDETERAFRVFIAAVDETARRTPRLKEGARQLNEAAELLENLRETAAEFKIPAPAAPELLDPTDETKADFVEFQMTAD